MTNDEKKYALNTSTGRYCAVGSKTYIRAKKGGFIQGPEVKKPEETEPEVPTTRPPSPEPNVLVEELNSDKLKSKLAKECTDIVNQHMSHFKGITQKQTDALLKKLLYEKLCEKKNKKETKKPKKKPKKLKFKIKEPSSGESSQSESESSESE